MIKLILNSFMEGTEQAREDWGIVYQQPFMLNPYRFLDTETQKEYITFYMGVAFPTHNRAGCVIMLGITDKQVIEVREIKMQKDVYDLFQIIIDLRYQYCYSKVSGLLEYVIGDETKYRSICNKMSQELEKRVGDGKGIYIKEPENFNQTNCLQIYLNHLKHAMSKKKFELKNNADAIDELSNIQPEEAQKGKVADYPVAGLLGAMVHTILFAEGQKEEHQPEMSEHIFNIDELGETK